jgi:excinuclease ABC subunit B
MKRTIDETARRRAKQEAYNKEHHITPTQIVKPRKSLLDSEELTDTRSQFGNAGGASGASKGSFGGTSKGSFGGVSKSSGSAKAYPEAGTHAQVASAEATYESIPALEAEMARAKERMLAAAKALDFMEAAQQRDYMLSLEERIERLKKSK